MTKEAGVLTVFRFQEAQDVRVIMRGDEPWWVAKDVCGVLGLKNNRDAVEKLDRDERNSVGITDGTPGNPQYDRH